MDNSSPRLRRLLRRSVAALVATGLAGTVGVATAATPAMAVPGLTLVAQGSVTNADPVKMVTVACPRGTVAIDGGGQITGGDHDGQVRLTSLASYGSGFEAVATAGNGYRGDWRLNAYAICAPDLYRITFHQTVGGLSDQWWRSGQVTCPGGKKLIGAGAFVHDANLLPPTGVTLHLINPAPDLGSVTVQAYRVDDGAPPWRLGIRAACADPLPGLERVLVVGTDPAEPAVATCPAGKQVHGMAGGLNAAPGSLALTRIMPNFDLSQVLAGGATVAGENPPPWQPFAVAICAD
jgi:hypothetical protein